MKAGASAPKVHDDPATSRGLVDPEPRCPLLDASCHMSQVLNDLDISELMQVYGTVRRSVNPRS